MTELREGFAENNPKGVQVQGFLDTDCYRQVLSEITDADFKKSEQRDTHSYFEASPDALEFFSSQEFLSFVAAVTGKKLRKVKCSLRMFMAGNYTLMHDEEKARGVEFIFDMTANWQNEWGGATVFITEGGEKLVLPPQPNTLIIAEAGRSYVKYANHLADSEGRLMVYGLLSK